MSTAATTDDRYARVIATLVTLLEGRNPYNVDHCKLVAHYTELTARRAGVAAASAARARRAAEFHTVGLLLQMEEKRLDQSLPAAQSEGGVDTRGMSMRAREEQILRGLLGGAGDLDGCIEVILQRHEWYDGTGSSRGLRGSAILEEARVLAVADAFVDLATPKSHRAPVTLNDVFQSLRGQAGTQFEPRFVDALASAVLDEEDRWGAAARARRFEASRCRHWLHLGHFYRQSGEVQWAFRCYTAAQRVADEIGDADLELAAVNGLFLGYCDLKEFERARDVLSAARKKAADASPGARQGMQLLWGLLECHQGREENALQILEALVGEFEARGDVEGLAAASGLVANVLLLHRGVGDPLHLEWLRRFMALVAKHDLFDVVIRYRPQTIPLLLAAVMSDIESSEALELLSRMGEPCHGALQQKLGSLPPSEWMSALRPPTALPVAAPTAAAPTREVSSSGRDVWVASLGSFVISRGDARITEEDWPTQKAMRLFAMLAHKRGATVPCRQIIEDLWPDRDELHARSSLRNAVHQVRTLLRAVTDSEDELSVVRNRKSDTISLKGEYLLDTDAFEGAVAEATLLHSMNRHDDAVGVLKQGLSLYRGDFLENARDEWSETLRSRLAECHLKGLQMLARCYLQLGDAEAAELVARRILSSDDLREEAHATLVEALEGQGRKVDALRHCQEAMRHLHIEIGLASPATLGALQKRLTGA